MLLFLIYIRELNLEDVEEVTFREGNICKDAALYIIKPGELKGETWKYEPYKDTIYKLWNICRKISRHS